jgi:signal transduction histidine kinase
MNKDQKTVRDERVLLYQTAIERMKRGDYEINLPSRPMDDCGLLGQLLNELACALANQKQEQIKLEKITASMNSGLMLEDILENIYRDFKQIIPYNRLGLALIEEGGSRVRTVWGKSDQPLIKIEKGYSAPLAGSSLEKIIKTRQPRIINDLLVYLRTRPQSESTHLIVSEGIRSSLTCPLLLRDEPVGFLFFSSAQADTYANVHITTYNKIAAQVAACLERGRLVSELAASKAEIEAQNQELRQLNEIKNSFLGIAAHDLRSPLSQIQLATSLLLTPEPWLPEEERRSLLESFLNNIEQHTRHMLDLLNDLLDVSQIETGRLNLKFETVNVKSFMEEVLSTHAVLAANKGTRLLLEDIQDDKMVVDPHRLKQVIDNLVSNVVKFSLPGCTVKLKAYRDNSHWVFSIEDEGSGIRREDREALSQIFNFQSKEGGKPEKDPSLGMAISKQVIEAHGGQLGVEPVRGGGARFWFTLPY